MKNDKNFAVRRRSLLAGSLYDLIGGKGLGLRLGECGAAQQQGEGEQGGTYTGHLIMILVNQQIMETDRESTISFLYNLFLLY
jgi:hypothetical protein